MRPDKILSNHRDTDVQEERQENPISPLDNVVPVPTGHVPDPEEAGEIGSAEGKTGVEGYRG
jgi:hypothetical protein